MSAIRADDVIDSVADALQFIAYHWPGFVRTLHQQVDRLVKTVPRLDAGRPRRSEHRHAHG